MKVHNYIHAKYTVAVKLAKTANEVYDHIINNVSGFWPEEFEGESKKLNDEFVFRSGDAHFSKNKLIELIPGKKVVWLVIESIRKTDNYKWTGAKMIFELSEIGNDTLLEFTYDGPVLENEYDRLVQVCEMVIKDKLYNYVMSGR